MRNFRITKDEGVVKIPLACKEVRIECTLESNSPVAVQIPGVTDGYMVERGSAKFFGGQIQEILLKTESDSIVNIVKIT